MAAMPCALLIAPPGQAGAAEAALTLLGTLATQPIAPEQAREALSGQCLLDLLALEATAMEEAALADLLPLVEAVAGARDTRVVVALREDQIDQVGGVLVASRATLLCEPTLSERVAAYAVRPATGAVLNDNDRQPQMDEIARLSNEVERIARTLARLTGEEAADAAARKDKRLSAFAPPPAGTAEIDPAHVRAAIRARRLREQFIDRETLGEPGWDILLDLFAADLEQLRVSVSSLCIAAAVPPTTALRWITGMTSAGLLERHADPRDRRRAFITLGNGARTGMRNYFAALQRQGLPFG